MVRRAGRSLLAVLLVFVLVMGIYLAYVFLSWYRVEDNLVLEVQTIHDDGSDVGLKKHGIYRIASYNIGFGAYSADYSFFMDGGKESRARSAEAVAENVAGAVSAAASLDPAGTPRGQSGWDCRVFQVPHCLRPPPPASH